MKKILNFFKEEDGLELSEYAVMGALIILGVTAAVIALQGQISTVFGSIITALGG